MAGSLGLRQRGRRRASRPRSASCVRLSCPENDFMLIIAKLANTTDPFVTRGLALYLHHLLKGRSIALTLNHYPSLIHTSLTFYQMTAYKRENLSWALLSTKTNFYYGYFN